MTLQALVSVERLCVDVAVRSKKHAIELAAGHLASCFQDLNANRLFDALIARERLGCTALGRGVALPHAAMDNIEHSAGCIVKFAEPIAFDDDDPDAVSLIFALVVPTKTQSAQNDELQMACDFLSHSENRRALLAAESPRELYDALGGRAEPRLPQAGTG